MLIAQYAPSGWNVSRSLWQWGIEVGKRVANNPRSERWVKSSDSPKRSASTPNKCRSGEDAKYRAIIDTAVDAIAVINEGGIVQSLNQAAEKMFGYSAAEVIGHNVNMLIYKEVGREVVPRDGAEKAFHNR